SFLTQKSRWASLVAQAAVQWAFLAFAYVVGIGLALVAARFYPDGLAMSPRGGAYLPAYLLVVLLWVTIATALAVLTRSVAVSVAAPSTPMLVGPAPGGSLAGPSVWPPAVALLVPAPGRAGAGLGAHARRDSA